MAAARDEIRAVLDQMIEAQNAGDAARVRSMLSERPDAVHIGTDDEEWWTSKQVVDAVAAAGVGDGIRAIIDDAGIHIQGDVAWTEARGRFTSPGGGGGRYGLLVSWPARTASGGSCSHTRPSGSPTPRSSVSAPAPREQTRVLMPTRLPVGTACCATAGQVSGARLRARFVPRHDPAAAEAGGQGD